MSTASTTSASTASPPGTAGAARRGHHPGIALAVIVTCQAMIIVDATVVNVALPAIKDDLHFSATALSWVLNAYALAFGGLLMLGGRAGDILGRRRVFMAGIALFTLASLGGGFAGSSGWLLTARVVQGVGAAAASPTALALIANMFTQAAERGRAIGIYGAVSGAGGGLGLVLGGMLVSWASWRWVMFINVPIGLAVFALAPLYIHESPRLPGRFDLGGAFTSTAGVSALVYAFVRASTDGWSDSLTLGAFAAAAVLLAAFVLVETRARQPIIPLRLFADRDRLGAYGARLLLIGSMFGLFFFLTQYVQTVLGFSALRTGFAFLPPTVLTLALTRLVPRLVPHYGMKAVAGAGIVVTLGAMAWLSRLTPTTGYTAGVLGPLVLFGVGLSFPFIVLTLAALHGVDPRDSGAASGMVNVTQQVGGALGLSVLVTVFGTAQRHAAAHPPLRATAAQRANIALTHGIAEAFTGGVVLVAAALLIALALLRGRGLPGPQPAPEPAEAGEG